MTDEQKRDCYYVMRAMHDATCPNCGAVSVAGSFEWEGSLHCRSCKFTITPAELRGIKKISAEVVAKRMRSFAECASELEEMGRNGRRDDGV